MINLKPLFIIELVVGALLVEQQFHLSFVTLEWSLDSQTEKKSTGRRRLWGNQGDREGSLWGGSPRPEDRHRPCVCDEDPPQSWHGGKRTGDITWLIFWKMSLGEFLELNVDTWLCLSSLCVFLCVFCESVCLCRQCVGMWVSVSALPPSASAEGREQRKVLGCPWMKVLPPSHRHQTKTTLRLPTWELRETFSLRRTTSGWSRCITASRWGWWWKRRWRWIWWGLRWTRSCRTPQTSISSWSSCQEVKRLFPLRFSLFHVFNLAVGFIPVRWKFLW